MEYNLKEQLFDKINGLKITDPNLKETWFNWGVEDAYERVEMFFNKELVPEVPQYVADWYEANKDDFEGKLFRCIDCIPSVYDEGDLNEFEEWIIDGETKPFQTLVNMHQFGYKVEKVDLYRVKLIHGAQHVATDLVLVGDDWWIERCEYDGSEWWEFKTIPTEKVKVVPILYLDRGMWDTLKDMNEDEL